MLLMSEGLADRVILDHEEDERAEKDQENSDMPDQLNEQKAIIQFNIGNEIVRCPVKKMTLSNDSISTTFVAVPSLPLRLRENAPVRCILSCGSYLLDFDLHTFDATWDNMEGKQLCTIISKIEQQARSSV
jgi:hypothetical protein